MRQNTTYEPHLGFFWATLNSGMQGEQPSAKFRSPKSVIAAISLKARTAYIRLRVNLGRAPFVGNFKTQALALATHKIPRTKWVADDADEEGQERQETLS